MKAERHKHTCRTQECVKLLMALGEGGAGGLLAPDGGRGDLGLISTPTWPGLHSPDGCWEFS